MQKLIITEAQAQAAQRSVQLLKDELQKVLFGAEQLIDQVLIALLARGHVLLEGLPGLGKTELVKGISKSLALESKRIQFTPDLLPGDITGNPILQELSSGERKFVFHKGPLFANIVLADEINRASPKTQSALLEAMQERRVTVMGETHELPFPFFVLATQNPIELEGTYPLPEAQLDRFLFKVQMPVPSRETLSKIVLGRELGVDPVVSQVLTAQDFTALTDLVRIVHLPQAVADYIARLIEATQPGNLKAVKFGAGPRAALGLSVAARASALMQGRAVAAFEDVRAVAESVLGHRVVLEYAARVQGITTKEVVRQLLEKIPVVNGNIPTLMERV